jgi:hypothetical protein
MFSRLLFVVLAIALVLPSQAQTPIPVATYTLHTQKLLKGDNGVPYGWALGPDNSLLVLLPRSDGQWVLKKFRSWETLTPTDDELIFAGETPKLEKWASAALTVSPSGKYLIIRIDRPDNGKVVTILALVDIHSFTLIWRRMTNDPLLRAFSDWKLIQDDHILASAHEPRTDLSEPLPPVGITRMLAGELSLPDLNPTFTCKYTLRKVNDTVPGHWVRQSNSNSQDCIALLLDLDALSIETLLAYDIAENNFERLDGTDCEPAVLISNEDRYAIYKCGKNHAEDFADGFFEISTARVLKVITIPEKKSLLSVPVGFFSRKTEGLLANANGHDYLIVFRDGTKLETYRLP